MLFAVLDFSDFAVIAFLIVICAGSGRAASAYLRPSDPKRPERVEQKLDLILTHLGIEYVPQAKALWQELADDPNQKINAIVAYRKEFGAGLLEAKRAVENYIEGKKGGSKIDG